MANATYANKLIDTPKRAVIALHTEFDGSGQETNVLKIDAQMLANAANANNMVMSANVHIKPVYRTTIKGISYNCGLSAGHIKIHWDGQGSNSNVIAMLASKTQGSILGDSSDMVIENQNANNFYYNPATSNSNGDILITSSGAQANDSYSIWIDLRKDPRDYVLGIPR